jgi:hypothetical protein
MILHIIFLLLVPIIYVLLVGDWFGWFYPKNNGK